MNRGPGSCCGVVLSTALFAAVLPGCSQNNTCPGGANSPPASSSGELATPYVGSGNPFEPGPLTVRTTSVDRCVDDAPVPLRIHAPEEAGVYAVVVFQHGFLALNSAYDEILRQLASHGFIVVAPQMYEPGLPVMFGNPTAAQEAELAAAVIDWLPAHLSAAAGVTARTDLLGLAGHSRGGKVAWLILKSDPTRARAIAGVDPVDGTGGPGGHQARAVQGPFPFSLPTLVIGTGLGGSCAPTGDNHVQFYEAASSPAWHVVAVNQGHADMLDEDNAAAGLGLLVCRGGPDRAGMRRLTGGLLAALFRNTLQGDPSARNWLTDAAAAPIPIVVEAK